MYIFKSKGDSHVILNEQLMTVDSGPNSSKLLRWKWFGLAITIVLICIGLIFNSTLEATIDKDFINGQFVLVSHSTSSPEWYLKWGVPSEDIAGYMNQVEYLNVTRNNNHYTFSYYFVDYDHAITDQYELGVIEPIKDYNGHSLCLIPQKNLFKCDYYYILDQGKTHNTTAIDKFSKDGIIMTIDLRTNRSNKLIQAKKYYQRIDPTVDKNFGKTEKDIVLVGQIKDLSFATNSSFHIIDEGFR